MDLESLKILLNEIKEKFKNIKEALKTEEKKASLINLEKETMKDGFWENASLQSEVLSEIKNIKNILEKINTIEIQLSEMEGYYEIASEINETESYNEAISISKILLEKLNKLEIDTLLYEEYDKNNAILTIHPGAGGTESQDWAEMLYRMYMRFVNKNEFDIELLDFQDGEEAGIKSVSFLVKGENAYGYLRGENGVHRLVRISPFDSNSRRHTSFAAVEVLPEITENIDVVINPEDIEMDVYRASGAGGQHVNKTSSAVRLTHVPTGRVVACQTERSQLQNRENAMKMLRSKIYEIEQEKQNSELANTRRLQVGSGARSEKIRTYNYPQSRVTDHRINHTIYQLDSFLNGNIEEMVEALIAADRADRLKEGEI